MPGIGIAVFYRCAGASSGNVNGVPRPIEMPDTLNDLRIVLVTAELMDDPDWSRYLDNSIAETRAKAPHAVTVRVALSAAITGGADLAIGFDHTSAQAADQILQLAILQACRLLSGRPRDVAGGNRARHP